MTSDWIDLCPLDELPADAPALRKAEGGRFVCVRRGEQVHALDDRCPHQGYPLSQGALRDGVLTCAWHNWKFDVSSGDCAFGGEAVRSYPTRVEGGRVFLNRAIDAAAEARRLEAGVRAALVENDAGRTLRDGLRLGAVVPASGASGLGATGAVLSVIARDGAERAPWGFDHPLALLSDLCSWTERGWLAGDDAVAVAATAAGETYQARPARARPEGTAAGDRVRQDLDEEERAAAELGVRALVGDGGPAAVRTALLPFVAQHLYDYGHGAIFLAKSLELSRRFPEAAEEVLASVTVTLGWATAETSLPPFAATRGALARLGELPARAPAEAGFDRRRFEEEVLGHERTAVDAAVARLAEGCSPHALLRAIAHAAAVRVARFDPAWETRVDAEVGFLDVTHSVTFCESALALTAPADTPPLLAAQLVVLAAGFVGKLRRGDRGSAEGGTRGDRADDSAAAPGGAASLQEAVQARDLPGAMAALAGLDRAGRVGAYAEIAPFAALDAAVRPILIAHTVKLTEAMHRLELADPEADDAYLRALLGFLVPVRGERRHRRTAAVAKKFLADGRPPEGLY